MRNVREVERCLRAIQANNRYLNAFTNIYSKESLLHDCILSEDRNASGVYSNDKYSLSVQTDRMEHTGSPLSSIDGLVIALKDNISARGLPTTCASETLRGSSDA